MPRLLFSTMILVAIVLHLERFHFGAANGAIARFGDQVQWREAGAWIWVALLLNAIVTGGYQLLATAGGTAQGQPAIIR